MPSGPVAIPAGTSASASGERVSSAPAGGPP
jgi:hypothetical protein